MTWFDELGIAWDALRRNAMRSALTMLGVIIGVGAVVCSMAIGSGAQAFVLAQIESLGANLGVVLPGTISNGGVSLGAGSQTTLTVPDAAAIDRIVPDVAATAPVSYMSAVVVAGNLNWDTSIQGTSPTFAQVRDWPTAEGRFFDQAEVDHIAKVAVLGETVAQNLFPVTGAVGSVVVISGVPFRVVGVLEAKGQSVFGRDQDDAVIVPITTMSDRLTGNGWVGAIYVSAERPEDVPSVVSNTERLLRFRHRLSAIEPDDFSVRNAADIAQVRLTTAETQALLLAGVAVVSLIVGGIGIMNIMLVSVTERTHEIGLRMAIGARGWDIMLQFMIEAVTLAAFGGLVGVGAGAGAAVGAAALGHWPLIITPFSMILGCVSSLAIGAAFGLYPAARAAHLDPIAALRYE